MSSNQKFCNHKYVAGQKKGQICGVFCRSGKETCYRHLPQSQRPIKLNRSPITVHKNTITSNKVTS
jgi:hypothetical protein